MSNPLLGTQAKLKKLSRLYRELLRRKAFNDPNAFLSYALTDPEGRYLRQGKVHKELQHHYTRHDRAIVVFPREHGKTTQTLGRVLWELGKDPNLRIKIICASDRLAAKRVRFLRSLVDSPAVKEVFPYLEPDKTLWTARAFSVKRKGGASVAPSIEACGVTSSATGDRADLLVLDDVTDEKNSLWSPTTRNEIAEIINNKWLNLVHPEFGRVWWIGTPWHYDDALMRATRAGTFAVFRRAIDDSLTPIWPQRWD